MSARAARLMPWVLGGVHHRSPEGRRDNALGRLAADRPRTWRVPTGANGTVRGMYQPDTSTTGIRIQGPSIVLRPLRAEEIDEEWRAMVDSDPMAIAKLPDEAEFRKRLQASGRMRDGWLDLAVDLDGRLIGRIQTFVPPHREVLPGTHMIGIGLREPVRGRGHGREALALFTGWLFEHAAAEVVEAPTDPANLPMRTVFERVGWSEAETYTDFDRTWVMYRVTREQWSADRG